MYEALLAKDRYDIADLLEIMTILRSPTGCPWDREQTHASIRKSFVEETYEVIEAINKDDAELLCEELGDVLLQVVFHAELEREKGVFDFSDVCDGICKKLIVRHPHVFGDVTAETSEEVLSNWDAIKRRTKKQTTTTQAMESVPRELPALMRAQKLLHKGKKAGYEPEIDPAGGIGQKLMAVLQEADRMDVDAEQALSDAADAFLADFAAYEQNRTK